MPGCRQTDMMLLPIIFLVFYLLLIRPQQKRAKEAKKMLDELKKGDEVLTSGGIIGRISGVKENEIILQVQDGVRIRMQKSAVTGRLKPPSSEPPKTEAKAS